MEQDKLFSMDFSYKGKKHILSFIEQLFSYFTSVLKRRNASGILFCSMIRRFFLFPFLMMSGIVFGQYPNIGQKEFFTDDRVIEMTLVTDFKKLNQDKLKKGYELKYLPATISCIFPDSSKVREEIEIRSRGQFRREECVIPPLLVNFKIAKAVNIKKLGRLKLVWPCGNSPYDEQLVLKEYLAYKIYNQLTEKSFRVRLVRMSYRDVNEKMKPITSYAFFIEDVDHMARRNNCIEIQSGRINTSQTNRELTTLLSLFEYMIGNSDWAIPIYRNVKLMRRKNDSLSRPFVVPYDLDYSGLVNARYAVPPEGLPITSVRERYYLGFPRTMEELQAGLNIFRAKRQAMDSLIMSLEPLGDYHKKEMIKYLREFFDITEKERDVKEIFINNARRD